MQSYEQSRINSKAVAGKPVARMEERGILSQVSKGVEVVEGEEDEEGGLDVI